MEFLIKNLQKNINNIMRTVGYMPAFFQNDGEFSVIRKVGRNDYPRFHLYIREEEVPRHSDSSGQMKGKNLIFYLHLDQKKPSYKGAKGHSGEYEGDLVEGEAERIKSLLIMK